ncbi:hypothetical protein C4K18_3005 [Pseudomonas chlororaphis subsp. aurantiaca]|nr:hypothetical protein C4K18_3005 [Pseudomonas chlororaphis subsp. aurantiaca]
MWSASICEKGDWSKCLLAGSPHRFLCTCYTRISAFYRQL